MRRDIIMKKNSVKLFSFRNYQSTERNLIVAVFILTFNLVYGSQEFSINFKYPSFKGDFYLSGIITFQPGAVMSEKNVIVRSLDSKNEIPTKIKIINKWADGSVLDADIVFAANSAFKQGYALLYGDDVKRDKIFSETAVLPALSFSTGGMPKASENIDVNVGQINVRVDKSSNFYYYWHVIPIVLLLLVTYYRHRRTKKTNEI